MTRLAFAFWMSCLVPIAASGQAVTLTRPSPAPTGASVLVNLAGTPKPDPTSLADPSLWVVVARTAANPVGTQLPLSTVAATPDYPTSGQVRISFATPVTFSALTEMDVVCLLGKPSRVTWKRRKPAGSLGVFPVDKREKADVAIVGSWVTGVNAVPLYNVDLQFGAPVRDFGLGGKPWRWSLASSWKSAARRDLDPDSYSVVSRLGLIFPIDLGDAGPYFDFQWETVRLEFSRKDEASNFVTAPTGTFSQNLIRKLRPNKTVIAALDFEPSLGFELGANLQNKIVPEGYGAIVRIVPGVALYGVFPGALGLDEIRWTTIYRARILASREPLIDLRDDQTRTSLTRGVRREWTDELLLKVTPLVGITIKHEYGSTPPAFKLLDHKATVGVAVMWAWKK